MTTTPITQNQGYGLSIFERTTMQIATIIFVSTLLAIALLLLWWANSIRKRDFNIIVSLSDEVDALKEDNRQLLVACKTWEDDYRDLKDNHSKNMTAIQSNYDKETVRLYEAEKEVDLLNETIAENNRENRVLSTVSQGALSDLSRLHKAAREMIFRGGEPYHDDLMEELEAKYNFSLIRALTTVETEMEKAEREETDALLQELRDKLKGN